MSADRRLGERRDRRAHPRGGRRDGDQKKPWYMRRRLWLAAASVVFVGWRRVRSLAHPDEPAPADTDDLPRYGKGRRG